jgi:hypothetical protein
MKRNAILLLIALSITTPALAAPGDMNVAEFLRRADALRALGPAALLSGDMGVLRAEGEAAGTQYTAHGCSRNARKAIQAAARRQPRGSIQISCLRTCGPIRSRHGHAQPCARQWPTT